MTETEQHQTLNKRTVSLSVICNAESRQSEP